jgi:hypothetical protein
MSKKRIYAVIVEYTDVIGDKDFIIDSYWFNKDNAIERIEKLRKAKTIRKNGLIQQIYYDGEYIADSEEVE